VEGFITKQNTEETRLYGSVEIPVSEKDYLISLEALLVIIQSICGDNHIDIVVSSKVDPNLWLITVNTGDCIGGCFYDRKSKEAHGVSQNWADCIEAIIKKRRDDLIDRMHSEFDEEKYNQEKERSSDGMTKEEWASGMLCMD
jgi:hypothetical protein